MKVIYGLGTLKVFDTAVAIGIFDGVHRGHQLLIKKMVTYARRKGQRAFVLTFFPHPAHVLRPDINLPYLMTLDERLKQIERLGVDAVLVIPFNKRLARIDPRSFIINTLKGHLGVKAIFVGEDFRFGRDRSGDIALFKECSRPLGLYVDGLKALRSAKEVISSSRIRRLISEGKITQAARLLGRPVAVEGSVVKGQARGTQLGFPTANINCQARLIPAHGVYAVRVYWGKKEYAGMANIGIRPSFKDRNPKTHVEVHLFNFNRRIYGQTVRVEFVKRVRHEIKFPSIDALKAQIIRDDIKIRRLLKVE